MQKQIFKKQLPLVLPFAKGKQQSGFCFSKGDVWLEYVTRPDIAFAMSTIAQYSENLGWQHLEAVKWIFCYLSGMKKMELTYGGEERGLVGYVDADGVLQDHRRAISGYVLW